MLFLSKSVCSVIFSSSSLLSSSSIQIQDDNIEEDDNNEDEENITEQTLLLKNNMGYLKERKMKSIIRYFKGKYDDDITRIRCVMLLFHPFRNEVVEVHNIFF